jgi:hypothetical protein
MLCKICNKQFNDNLTFVRHLRKDHNICSKHYYNMFIKKEYEGICPVCGKPTPYLSISVGYQKHCGCKCAQNNPQVFNTFRDNNPQKMVETKIKTQQTNLERYGVTNPFKSPEIQQKHINTLMEKYGVTNSYQIPNIKEKAIVNSHTTEANNKRVTTVKAKIKKIEKEFNCTQAQKILNKTKSSGWYQCGVVEFLKIDGLLFVKNEDIPTIIDYDNNSYNVYSMAEKKIVTAIKSCYKGKVIENSKKIICPKELDIYLPKLQIAVEYNGVWFHSEEVGTNKNYHLDKSLLCREKGIRLIHIYEFEDLDYQITLLIDLICNNVDNYAKDDFNKNNLLPNIPKPELIFNDGRLNIWGAGKLK